MTAVALRGGRSILRIGHAVRQFGRRGQETLANAAIP
jgi:hypothetical protein